MTFPHILKDKCYLIILLVIIASTHFLTMPNRMYQIDSEAMRINGKYFAQTGDFGIKYEHKELITEQLFRDKGRYLFENDSKQRYFQRWGIINTFIFSWAFIFQNALGKMGVEINDVLATNLMNIFFTLLLAFYMFKILGLYSKKEILNMTIVLATLYASFIWNYTRIQVAETYQMMFFTMFYYYFIKNLRNHDVSDGVKSGISLYLLTLSKFYYFLIWPLAIGVFLLKKWRENKVDIKDKSLIVFIALFGLTFLSNMGLNAYQFGGAFKSGYSQFFSSPWEHFTLNPLNGFLGYTVFVKGSVFWHMPLLFCSLAGLRKFTTSYREESYFLISFFIILLIMFSFKLDWLGEWCYGPRYLILPMLISGIPALYFLQEFKLLSFKQWTIASFLIFLNAGSFVLQTYVNKYDFFLPYRVKGAYSQALSSSDILYFDNVHYGMINYHVERFLKGDDFYPDISLKTTYDPKNYQLLSDEIKSKIKLDMKVNYYFSREEIQKDYDFSLLRNH